MSPQYKFCQTFLITIYIFVKTVHEDEILTGQAHNMIDLSNKENTLENYLDYPSPTLQVLSNISQKNSQLLEKSVTTIHEDENTLFHKQVHL